MSIRPVFGALSLALLVGAMPAKAEKAFPAGPVTFVVGYAPGGPMDIVARLVAEGVREPLGVPVLVENKAGAAGSIAADQVARSAPDGSTALATSLNHVTNAVLNKGMKFDTEQAFEPVAIVAVAPHALVVRAESPLKNYGDFLKAVREHPGSLTVANSGAGGSPHLVAEMFQLKTGTSFVNVPYKGAAPAVTDLIGGHVDASFATLGSVLSQIKAGQVRALAVASDGRSPLLPETPTFGELGVDGLSLDSWYGVLFPAGTAPEVVARLHGAIGEAVKAPAFRDKLLSAGMAPVLDSTPENYKKRISDEIRLVREITEKAGISLD